MDYRIENLTKEDAEYIGEKINEIVPHEVDADEEEFVLKVEDENGQIIGGCIAEAYEYHWSRVLLEELWVDERYRHQGIGSMIIREVERIAREKGCRVVTLGTASYMARPFYEKHGYAVFTTLKMANGYIDYSLVKYLDKDTPNYVPKTTAEHNSRFPSAVRTMRILYKPALINTMKPTSRNTKTLGFIRNLWTKTVGLRLA